MEAKIPTTSPWIPEAHTSGAAGARQVLGETVNVGEQAFIHTAIPCPKKTDIPKPLEQSPARKLVGEGFHTERAE